MHPIWLLLASAVAGDPGAPGISGFDRLHADPTTLHLEPEHPELPVRTGTLVIHNGHTARATVSIGGVQLGELLPQATGRVSAVVYGTYLVRFDLPDGHSRTERIEARSEETSDAD